MLEKIEDVQWTVYHTCENPKYRLLVSCICDAPIQVQCLICMEIGYRKEKHKCTHYHRDDGKRKFTGRRSVR